MSKKTIILERRGCDFWKDCPERKNSNLENFRLCGKIKNRQREYFLEICTTHTTTKQFLKRNRELGIGATYCVIDNEFTAKNGLSYRDMKKFTICHPTREAVIVAINKVFGTAYSDLEILPYGETLKD